MQKLYLCTNLFDRCVEPDTKVNVVQVIITWRGYLHCCAYVNFLNRFLSKTTSSEFLENILWNSFNEGGMIQLWFQWRLVFDKTVERCKNQGKAFRYWNIQHLKTTMHALFILLWLRLQHLSVSSLEFFSEADDPVHISKKSNRRNYRRLISAESALDEIN